MLLIEHLPARSLASQGLRFRLQLDHFLQRELLREAQGFRGALAHAPQHTFGDGAARQGGTGNGLWLHRGEIRGLLLIKLPEELAMPNHLREMIRRIATAQHAEAEDAAVAIQRDERVRATGVADDVVGLRRGLHHLAESDARGILHDLKAIRILQRVR